MAMSKLYVGNLPFRTTEDNLRAFFEETAGPVADVKIIMDRETGRSRGFAFVSFETDDGARKGMELNDQEFEGRRLKINEAHERAPREGGGGGGGFGGGGGGGRGGDRGPRGGGGDRGGYRGGGRDR